jgi:hypothetical protein
MPHAARKACEAQGGKLGESRAEPRLTRLLTGKLQSFNIKNFVIIRDVRKWQMKIFQN